MTIDIGALVRIDMAIEGEERGTSYPQPDYNALWVVTDTDGERAIVAKANVIESPESRRYRYWIVDCEALIPEGQ